MSTMPNFIREQILYARPPEECSVPDGSLPALVEGHLAHACIASVGINPRGAWHSNWYLPMDAGGTERFWDDKERYFEHRKYRYFSWLEPILNQCGASWGGKYDPSRRYASSAVSLDVVQWPTNPLWSSLDEKVKQKLLDDGVPFFKEILQQNPNIELLLGNGRTAVEQIEGIFRVQFRKQFIKDMGMCLYQGDLLNRRFIGWSRHLSSPVKRNHRAALAKRVSELYCSGC